MAEPNEVPKDPAVVPSSTTAPSEAAAPEGGEPAGEQSKKGAKKAEAKAKKEAEKARKAAEREAAAKAAGTSGPTEDLAKDNYGNFPAKFTSEGERVRLEALADNHVGKLVKIRGILQNSRMQGAKIAFIQLGKGGESIQGVIAANAEGKPVSRPMVKWTGTINVESLIMVEAIVEKPVEPVKSCTISNYELHIQRIYLVVSAPEMLPLSVADASRAVGGLDDDDDLVKATAGLSLPI
jgi:lysyl-tRNA synthetase class II